MRWGLTLVVVGLALAVALLVLGPRVLRSTNEEPAATAEPVAVPFPVLDRGIATLADIASIENDFSRNAALYTLIGDATRMDVEEWLAQVDTLAATRHRSDIARVLYIRFTVLDPDAALEHALQGETKASWLAAIFRTWGQIDPDAAAARAGALLPSARAVASRALLELDLPRAELLAMTKRLDESRTGDDMQRRYQLMAGKPQTTPDEYLLAEIEARTHARRQGESHADAWSRATGVGDALVRQILLEQILLDWSMTDPVAAMAAVDAWDTDDVYVRRGATGTSSPLQPMLRLQIMHQWARRDAQTAFSWAMRQHPTDMQMHVATVLAVLAETAPGEAVARLADLPESFQERAAGNLLWTLARTDLERAVSLFESLGIEAQSYNTIVLRQEFVSQRSPQEALDWTLSLDLRIRPREVAAVIQSLYHRDHAEALGLLDAIEDPAIRAAAATGLVRQQVQRDAPEALAWARRFRPEVERGKLVVQVFNAWSRTDPRDAWRALLETRAGPTRDRAAAAMMSSVVAHDSLLAERLFDSIETSEQQDAAGRTLYRHFTEVDPIKRKADRYRKYLPPDDDDDDDGEENP